GRKRGADHLQSRGGLCGAARDVVLIVVFRRQTGRRRGGRDLHSCDTAASIICRIGRTIRVRDAGCSVVVGDRLHPVVVVVRVRRRDVGGGAGNDPRINLLI